jgi:hypothetical protein
MKRYHAYPKDQSPLNIMDILHMIFLSAIKFGKHLFALQ